MIIVNHKYFVSFEIANLLKEAGFDWECEHCYNNGEFDEEYYEPFNFNKDCLYQISAPTLDDAQRWLREVGNKNGTVILTLNFNENISKHWEVKGIHLNKDRTVMQWFYTCHVKLYGRGIIPVDCFNTYEEALEAGIKEALEIILNKE